METTAQRHLAAIHDGRVNKTNVIGIRKALAHVDRIRIGYSGNRSNVTRDEADKIEAQIFAREPIVIGELRETGLKLLRNPRYAKRFDERQRATIEAPDAFFQLVRFDRVKYQRGLGTIVPVYRIIGAGDNFVFRNVPWQSGGRGPEVQGRNF